MKKLIQMIVSLHHLKNLKQEKGQSLVIFTFSIVGLIAFMGLGLDLGLVYIERTTLKRAIDAAVLSGVTELTNEEEAAKRAIDYLGLNNYDLNDTNIYFRGCLEDKFELYDTNGLYSGSMVTGSGSGGTSKLVNADVIYPYFISYRDGAGLPDDSQARNIFIIDTYAHQEDHLNACKNGDPKLLGEANRLEITGTAKVSMNFFAILGFGDVPVTDHSIAQNVDKLDLVIVLDKSGSMEWTPVCYGCWKRRDQLEPTDALYIDPAATANDTPRYKTYTTYPSNGVIYPLGTLAEDEDPADGQFFDHPDRIKACTTELNDPSGDGIDFNPYETFVTYQPGSVEYHNIIIEAEMYTINTVPPDLQTMVQGRGYWAFQRGEARYSSGNHEKNYALSIGTSFDALGAHMSHHPLLTDYQGVVYGKHYTKDEALTYNIAPSLWYDFEFYNPPSPSPIIWVSNGQGYIWVRVHAGLGLQNDPTKVLGDTHPDGPGIAYWELEVPGDTFKGTINVNLDKGNDQYWHWVRLETDTTPDFLRINTGIPYRLKIYAGSAGFSIDRIVVTDNPLDTGNNGDGAALGDNVKEGDLTMASASPDGVACDRCNPIYGEYVVPGDCTLLEIHEPTHNSNNVLFSDWEMPMRNTKEAIKFITTRMNPENDQLGLVTYSSPDSDPPKGIIKTELACKQAERLNGNFECFEGSTPYSYTEIIKAVEDTDSHGGTPTAEGLKAGLEVIGFPIDPPSAYNKECNLNVEHSSCARGGASQRIVILITDGSPNFTFGRSTSWDHGCTSSAAPEWTTNTAPYRCPLFYARRAAESGINVYAVGLGYGVDTEYIKEIARQGNGTPFFSASGADLNPIFNEILSNLYVRLVD